MKNYIVKILVAIIAIGMTSCLKDDDYALDPSKTQNVIEFLNPSIPISPFGSVYPAWGSSFVFSPEDDFNLVVSYSGPQNNNRDIQVEIIVDPSALEEYNRHMVQGLNGGSGLHGPTYELMPTSYYSLGTTLLAIPKGETKVTLPITVFPDQFDFSKSYALPLRIVSASHGILSAQFSVAILSLGVRNIYDGIYEIKGGSITRNSASGPDLALGGTYNEGLTMDLVTLNASQVGIIPLWKEGSEVGGVAGTNLVINSATNAVTVTSTGNPTLKNTAARINEYDPSTKTFTINFDWGNAPNTRIVQDLKLTYIGPRHD